MSSRPDWIPEVEAAKMMQYKPETLRRYVKAGKFDIAYTNPNNRNFQYDRKDIDKVLLDNSTFINKNKSA